MGGKGGIFICPRGSETLEVTYEGLGEMFQGDFADKFSGKFPLTSRGAKRKVLHAQTR